MKNKEMIKKLEKKHSLFWIYETQIKMMFCITAIISVCYFGTILLFNAPIDYQWLLDHIFHCLISGCLIFLIGVILKNSVLFIFVLLKRMYNIRYIPVSEKEIELLNISNLSEYLDVTNSLINPSKNLCYHCPKKIKAKINAFVLICYDKELTFCRLKGFSIKEEELE